MEDPQSLSRLAKSAKKQYALIQKNSEKSQKSLAKKGQNGETIIHACNVPVQMILLPSFVIIAEAS